MVWRTNWRDQEGNKKEVRDTVVVHTGGAVGLV